MPSILAEDRNIQLWVYPTQTNVTPARKEQLPELVIGWVTPSLLLLFFRMLSCSEILVSLLLLFELLHELDSLLHPVQFLDPSSSAELVCCQGGNRKGTDSPIPGGPE